MDEIVISFGDRQKRKLLMRMACLVLLFAAAGAFLAASAPASTAWLFGLILLLCSAFAVFSVLKKASGATVLMPDRIVLRTLNRSMSLPWGHITRIEVKRRSGRGGSTWMVARIHCPDGERIELPGLQQSSVGQSKREFQHHVGILLEHWQKATGRTEVVLVTP